MLHTDDLPPDVDPRTLIWVEHTVRVLVPEAMLAGGLTTQIVHAETIDQLSTSQSGRAGRCTHCGLVTIETRGFPWGYSRYQLESYCPHCNGAEDMG